ncbi:MAG: hypothetical protein Q9214_005231, partial [Letrouitia sp. 1 TL-2023]
MGLGMSPHKAKGSDDRRGAPDDNAQNTAAGRMGRRKASDICHEGKTKGIAQHTARKAHYSA